MLVLFLERTTNYSDSKEILSSEVAEEEPTEVQEEEELAEVAEERIIRHSI